MNILVCDSIHKDGIEKLRRANFLVDVKPRISYEELKNTVSNYDGLIVRSRTKITKEIIERGKKLKVIGRAGVGLDNIDLAASRKREIAVFNTPEAPSQAVAELTIGLLLSLARQIPFADRTLKEGKWIKKKFVGWQLKGKTLGLIGLGNIGEKVAKIAKSFEMKLLITKRTPPNPKLLAELEGRYISRTELLQNSDIISLHVPLTLETYHMISVKEFQTMKNGAVLINTSRGQIIDEQALLQALRSGKLAAVALDVHETEPPQNLTIVKMPNVVCTPHIGSQTIESQKEAAKLIAEQIISALNKKNYDKK